MKEIKRTNKYDSFKKLKGNREVSPTRIKKIIESINKVGYITSPVIVNENMEVIDGQGRLEALKYLGIPVEYIVHKGAGIEECLSMNIHQSNWTAKDYIKSYAERGNQSYIYLQELIEKYPSIGINNIIIATQEHFKGTKSVSSGALLVSESQYKKAVEKLDLVNEIVPKLKYLNGGASHLIYAILICSELEEVNIDRLKEVLLKKHSIMKTWNSVPTCLQSIEDIYNENLQYPVFIYTEYRKQLYVKLQGKMRKETKRQNSKYVEEN